MSKPGRLKYCPIQRDASAIPTLVATPCPSGPVVVSMPDVQRYSGCPGHLLLSCRKFLTSSSDTLTVPRRSYSGSTAFTCAKCSVEYSSMDACPHDKTNRSRLGQIGSSGSNLKNSCHSVYTTGASAIGVPGCPELAFW